MFLNASHDLKPKITITNSPLFGKSDKPKLKDDSTMRKKIELEYKQTVTRSLDDEEISRHVPEGLVDKILSTYHKKAQSKSAQHKLPKEQQHFNSGSFYVQNRHKMVHSAPAPRTQVHFKTKCLSDRGEHSQYTFRSAQSSSAYLNQPKKTSHQDAQKKINWNFKHEQNELKAQSKSIMRNQKPIVAKSLNVEKWIGIHRRRSTNVALSLATQPDTASRNEDFLANYEFLSAPNQKKSRSIRELSELTMLDKVQERLRRDINQKIKNLRKIESKNEFNEIVNRIKTFLDELENRQETSSFASSISTPRNNKITLYELALA